MPSKSLAIAGSIQAWEGRVQLDCTRGRRRGPGQGVRWKGPEGKEAFKKREVEIGKHWGEGRH